MPTTEKGTANLYKSQLISMIIHNETYTQVYTVSVLVDSSYNEHLMTYNSNVITPDKRQSHQHIIELLHLTLN